MIESVIRLAVKNKLVVGVVILGIVIAGIYNLNRLPFDAVPDITNNQVQVVTVSNSLAPQEIEQLITYPVEVAMANIPNVSEIRSISRFGLSVVTVVFEDRVPVLEARQFVKEQIGQAVQEIPADLGTPELMPITTGLGEIYQYVLEVSPGYEDQYDPMELRTIQDWIVKRQLAGIQGIIEISSFGGYLKQYEVALDPVRMRSLDVTISDVFEALSRNNQNTGGSYIEKQTNAFYIRTEGMVKTIEDIEQIMVAKRRGIPVLVRDVGTVQFGSAKRFGAMTMDGKGETVGGITLMLKGANSSEAIQNVKERVEVVRQSLPQGVELYPYLDRSTLVGKTIDTVKKNLIEGGLIVILVLFLLLGNIRAGLIVASIIPLSMLFAITLMRYFGVSANLMSLGAIDFGIVVDGAVIVVEGVLHTLMAYHVGKRLSADEMDEIIIGSSSKLFRSAVYGVFIILVVFVPIMTLTGIEGKMFRPMAMTFSFAVLGALLLSLTFVPVLASMILPRKIEAKKNWSDYIINFLKSLYQPTLVLALRFRGLLLGTTLVVLVASILLFRSMGAVFIPTLEEGDLAMQMAIPPGSSLQESIRSAGKAEKILIENFPEVRHVVSKIGTAEVPTDPMAIEDADIMIILKDKEEWTSAADRESLVAMMKEKLEVVLGAGFEFTQPIQLRFNELMTGAKADIAVQIFGEDHGLLKEKADEAAGYITGLKGAADVKVEQTEGLPQLMIHFDRKRMALYGLDVETLNQQIRAAFAGESAGVVFENERKFDLVVRLQESSRQSVNLDQLLVNLPEGGTVPMSEVASVNYSEGPMQISRENARRLITIGINVRNRDIASLVEDVRQTLDQRLRLPPGYSIEYGGQFENLEKAKKRLSVAVPIALFLIFVFLFFAFRNLKYALLIFSAVPLAAIGGVLALWIRGMPFSISAGVGFIALFGVAVLNGIVLISKFNQLQEEGMTDLKEVVIEGGMARLRPVLLTALVAALGFLPMALSTTNGAEVQRPLATVVIGGLITATLLTLILLPVLYYLVNRSSMKIPTKSMLILLLVGAGSIAVAQPASITLQQALDHAQGQHPALLSSDLLIQRQVLEEEVASRIDPLSVDLEAGQINSGLLDYRFSIAQPLRNRAAFQQRKELARSRQQLAQSDREVLQHEIVYQVRFAWNEWMYYLEHQRLASDQVRLLEQVTEQSELRQALGETSRLESTFARSALFKARQSMTQSSARARLAQSNLQQAAYYKDPVEPADTLFEVIQFQGRREAGMLLARPAMAEVQVAEEAMQLEETLLRPTWSIGYFNQSIRPDIPLQGMLLGVEIPIWKKAQLRSIDQARLDVEIAQQHLALQQFRVIEQASAAQTQIRLLQEELEQSRLLADEAIRLRELADTQFEEGEIDQLRYLQLLLAAMEQDRVVLDTRYRYNQAVLNWLYLSR
jgi:cobalt-zinc-cadmium resistance protein CzcA